MLMWNIYNIVVITKIDEGAANSISEKYLQRLKRQRQSRMRQVYAQVGLVIITIWLIHIMNGKLMVQVMKKYRVKWLTFTKW